MRGCVATIASFVILGLVLFATGIVGFNSVIIPEYERGRERRDIANAETQLANEKRQILGQRSEQRRSELPHSSPIAFDTVNSEQPLEQPAEVPLAIQVRNGREVGFYVHTESNGPQGTKAKMLFGYAVRLEAEIDERGIFSFYGRRFGAYLEGIGYDGKPIDQAQVAAVVDALQEDTFKRRYNRAEKSWGRHLEPIFIPMPGQNVPIGHEWVGSSVIGSGLPTTYKLRRIASLPSADCAVISVTFNKQEQFEAPTSQTPMDIHFKKGTAWIAITDGIPVRIELEGTGVGDDGNAYNTKILVTRVR